MSLFNIKVKTKNGNDIKHKEMFTVFFRLKYRKNSLNKNIVCEYTYRIIYSGGVKDHKAVLSLKNSENVKSLEDFTIKVFLNLFHLIGKISQKENINPDYIMFISPELNNKQNSQWRFTHGIFSKEQNKWDFINRAQDRLRKYNISENDIDLLNKFVEINPNTKFIICDPHIDPVKYAKSIVICDQLKERFDGTQLQITESVENQSNKS